MDIVFGLIALAVVVALFAKTFRIVPQASVFVIERLGKYSRTLNPGFHILLPVIDSVRVRVDVREQVVAFAPQSVITKDNLVVGIDSVIYYTVTDPVAETYQIENAVVAIEQLVVTTLRNVVGALQLEETLTSRDHINERLAAVLDSATGQWGIKVNRVELRAIEPPATIRDAMEQSMRADRSKRAAILTAEGQQQSAILVAEGAKQAAVLNAEAAKQSTILAAEAERESRLLRAEGEAAAIQRVVQAIKEAGVDQTVLAYQQLQLLPSLAQGSANKVWFVPTDVSGYINQARELLGGAPAASSDAAAPHRIGLPHTPSAPAHPAPAAPPAPPVRPHALPESPSTPGLLPGT